MDMTRFKKLAGIDEGGMWKNSKPSIILRHMADPSNAKMAKHRIKKNEPGVAGEDWFSMNDFAGIVSDTNISFSQLRLLFRKWVRSGIIEKKNVDIDGSNGRSWYRITNKGLDQIKQL